MNSERDSQEVRRSLRDDLCQHSFQENITTYQEIKDIILGKSVRAKVLFVVGAGLPYSGTSSLIRGILKLPELDTPTSHGLVTYSTAFFKDSVKKDGHIVVFGSDDESDGMLLLALTKLFITKQFKLNSTLQDTGSLFLNEEVDVYFKHFCRRLLGFMKDISENGAGNNPHVAITKSQSFINFLDITVNKAIYECLYIVGSWCRNGFLLSVLNLCYYSREVLDSPLDVSQPYFPNNRYRKEDVSLLKIHSACHFFLSVFEGTFSTNKESERAIVVYTHQDQLDPQVFEAKRQEVTGFIKESLKNLKIGDKFISSYLTVSNKAGKDRYKEIWQNLISLIENYFGHNNYIHLKDMFFYSYLKSKNKMYLSIQEVITLGEKNCNMEKEEVHKSLKLLHNSCFIFQIQNIVIFDLPKFIEGISMLYYIRSGDTENESYYDIDHGFLSRSTLHVLWQDLCDLYIDSLLEAGLMAKLHKCGFDFFMPSLRIMYEQETVTSTTTSLLVLSDSTIIPFHMQCLLIEMFQHQYPHQPLNILPSKMYNVLKLCFHPEVEVAILFCEKFLEISVDLKQASSILDEQEIYLYYSEVKLLCATFLNKIRESEDDGKFKPCDFSNFRYSFAVCCPQSSDSERHYITFQDTVREPFYCCICKADIDITDERRAWLSSPCKPMTLHPNDYLNYDNVGKLTASLLEDNSSTLENLCDFMNDINKNKAHGNNIESDFDELPERLFHSLYTWYLLNKSQSKIHLAKLLHENGYRKEAYVIEPLLKKWLAQEPTYTPMTEKEIIECAESWKGTCERLAQLLEVDLPNPCHSEVPDQEKFKKVIRSWIKANPCGHQYHRLSQIISNFVA